MTVDGHLLLLDQMIKLYNDTISGGIEITGCER